MTTLTKLAGIIAFFCIGLDFQDDGAKPERDHGRTCLALAAYAEARDQDDAGMLAVMRVVLNRATDPASRWPRSICDVVQQPGQFLGVEAWHYPRRPTEPEQWQRAMQLADVSIAGTDALPVACAHITSFNRARGAAGLEFACKIGAHTFYRDPVKSIAGE